MCKETNKFNTQLVSIIVVLKYDKTQQNYVGIKI